MQFIAIQLAIDPATRSLTDLHTLPPSDVFSCPVDRAVERAQLPERHQGAKI